MLDTYVIVKLLLQKHFPDSRRCTCGCENGNERKLHGSSIWERGELFQQCYVQNDRFFTGFVWRTVSAVRWSFERNLFCLYGVRCHVAYPSGSSEVPKCCHSCRLHGILHSFILLLSRFVISGRSCQEYSVFSC